MYIYLNIYIYIASMEKYFHELQWPEYAVAVFPFVSYLLRTVHYKGHYISNCYKNRTQNSNFHEQLLWCFAVDSVLFDNYQSDHFGPCCARLWIVTDVVFNADCEFPLKLDSLINWSDLTMTSSTTAWISQNSNPVTYASRLVSEGPKFG
jgi:hypothetical protein